MTRVNIYIYSSNNSPRRANGNVVYILEANTAKGPATITHKLSFENKTANEALLDGVIDAIGHINKSCEVVIYSTSAYLVNGINRWMNLWSAAGWKRSENREIRHKEKWSRIEEFLNKSTLTATLEAHEYLNWMKTEASNGE